MRAVFVFGLFAVSAVAGRMIYNIAPSEFDCTGQDVGLHTMEECTNIFYQCDGTNTIAVAQECPDQLVVNKDNGMCDWEYNVAACNGGGSGGSTTSTTTNAPINTGWTVIQRRIDGSVDFYQDWNEYVNGFGYPYGEFWLGLEQMHQLTKYGDHELRIDMTTVDGIDLYAQYSFFQISSAGDNYRLSVSGYSGTATDAFADDAWDRSNNHQQFSTRDNDNDGVSGSCAEWWNGAWWFSNCHACHLNGPYHETSGWRGIVWANQIDRTQMHMRTTEMKIRRRI